MYKCDQLATSIPDAVPLPYQQLHNIYILWRHLLHLTLKKLQIINFETFNIEFLIAVPVGQDAISAFNVSVLQNITNQNMFSCHSHAHL